MPSNAPTRPPRNTLRNKFANTLAKIFKRAQHSHHYLQEIAQQLSTQAQQRPQIVITNHLLEQGTDNKTEGLLPDKALEVFRQFCQQFRIDIFPPLELELEAILQKIASESLDKPILVDNLWRERTKTYECYCQLEDLGHSLSECYNCHRSCHSDCFWRPLPLDPCFECPVCFLSNCLPHKPVEEILFLGYLEDYRTEHSFYKMRFQLEVNRINIDNVEVRCVRLDNTNRFRVAFPENCRIDLASKTVKQFQPLPAASPLKRRRDCELPLEGQLLTYVNTLCVSKKAVFKEGRILEDDNYLIAVVYITPMAIPKAIATKYQNSRISIAASREKLRQMMSSIGDDCYQSTLDISLVCQFFQTSIVCPVRSKHCTHYQPFDLDSFVAISLKTAASLKAWRCPVCSQRAYDLEIDDYLLNLIQLHRGSLRMSFDRNGDVASVIREDKAASIISIDSSQPNHQDVFIEKQLGDNGEEEKHSQSLKTATNSFKEGIAVTKLKRTFEQRGVEEESFEPKPKKYHQKALSQSGKGPQEPACIKHLELNVPQIEAMRSIVVRCLQKREFQIKSSMRQSQLISQGSDAIQIQNQETVLLCQGGRTGEVRESAREESIRVLEKPREVLKQKLEYLRVLKEGLDSSGLTVPDKIGLNCLCRQLDFLPD